ncbi:Cysteine--tRNA ligase [Mactra antiquata]
MAHINPSVQRCFHSVKCLMRAPDRRRLDVLTSYHAYSTAHYEKVRSEWIQPSGTKTGIYIYNSLTRRKDELILPKGNTLTWYICGPTVYDASHIGHASNYVRYDIIRRILANIFHINVVYMMGITDIDDKIINKATSLGQEFTAITTYYERAFFKEMLALNTMQPTYTSRVTDFINEIVHFIDTIVKKGYGYKASDGSVYFDVVKYGNYNKFQTRPEKLPGEPGVKRHIQDFALWKAVKLGEPYWSSPWGPGRPGWHIECSAMASHVFGNSIDLHSGGADLMFPHHENEIAQSCSYHGCKQWANYWLHSGHLHLPFDVNKMSKSLKNVIPVSDLLQKYSANQFRMFCMLTHYRSHIEFTDEKMSKAITLDNKIGSFLQLCDAYVKGQFVGGDVNEAELLQRLADTDAKVTHFLKDDFNTPEAVQCLFDLISHTNKILSQSDDTRRDAGTIAAVTVYVKRLCKKLGFHKKGWKMTQDPDNMRLKQVLDDTVKFRWNVRNFAIQKSLPGLESLPKKERKKIGKEFFAPLLEGCDELRSKFSNHDICVQDHKTYSSWEFLNSGTMSEESDWEDPDRVQRAQKPDSNEEPLKIDIDNNPRPSQNSNSDSVSDTNNTIKKTTSD